MNFKTHVLNGLVLLTLGSFCAVKSLPTETTMMRLEDEIKKVDAASARAQGAMDIDMDVNDDASINRGLDQVDAIFGGAAQASSKALAADVLIASLRPTANQKEKTMVGGKGGKPKEEVNFLWLSKKVLDAIAVYEAKIK